MFGPVFSTPGKGEPKGLGELASAVASTEVPVLGLGGIDKSNYEQVMSAGARGFAAIRSLIDPVEAKAIMDQLSKKI